MRKSNKLLDKSGNLLPKMESDLSLFGYQSLFSPLDQTSLVYTIHEKDGNQILTSEQDSDSTDTYRVRPTRKRQRLDHLTQEEKIMRRKMKNRVAAQTARDRKKARMTELEEQVTELEAEKKLLILENFELKSKNEALEQENLQLKLRLNLVNPSEKEIKQEIIKEEADSKPMETDSEEVRDSRSVEHAAGAGSVVSYTLDDAIHLLADSDEPDDFLDLLQQCSEELLQCEIDFNSTSDSQNGKPESTNGEVVGSSAKGMESLKELVQADHIYYKKDEAEIVSLTPANPPLPESESSTKEAIPYPDIITDFDETECTVETSTINDPLVCLLSDDDSISPPNPTFYTTDPFSLQVPTIPDMTKICSSPVSSDAGYDSSFSPASSPHNISEDPWDKTFNELFPSLV